MSSKPVSSRINVGVFWELMTLSDKKGSVVRVVAGHSVRGFWVWGVPWLQSPTGHCPLTTDVDACVGGGMSVRSWTPSCGQQAW